ncbi:acyl-CoA dehydrogenase family protein [Amycolatopsis sp. WQ 127309]|uniref:acyl-CoA dehydrogenase family protein n=1 Tax=Amycolatopsis sp. WQ 127309 TaxID=2932773 RepID=UPI001FF0FCF8|nr:acyl-CoA dehydrogenase family protein [Amycolatopsis sp. WQ 127309]UOZ06684.1 acyl-CoA dehydrogenase family protein [Amycolatopsis sp. WQ 127309]
MTAVRSVSEEDYPSAPEPGLTPGEAIARAERIAATLVDRQAETEERGYYALDTHDEFLRAGLYRLLVPRRYGGYEFDLETHAQVVSALARGCPSTAWMYTFGASHALLAATLFSQAAQDELFANGDFICPATVGISGFAQPADDGGWIIEGVHPYSSGSPYATHFIGHTLVAGPEGAPPIPMLFVVPRAQWRRLDDWGAQLGLKGSGSHSVAIEKAHIPAHFGLVGTHMGMTSVVDGTPGQELHGNAMYGGGVLSSVQFPLAAIAIGMATGALDAYGGLMRERTTLFPPITSRTEDPDYQFRYGEAAGKIAAAEAALSGAVRQWTATAERGPGAFTREVDLRLSLISREAVRLCWSAVSEQLFPTAGSSSVRAGARLERVWRDMSTLHSHAGVSIFLASAANRELARLVFDVTN